MNIADNLALKEFSGNSNRTVGNCFGKLGLKSLGKAIVAFTCDYRQDIDGVNIIAQYIGIHALAILIDTKAQTASDFLPLAHFTAALFEGTNLEHIRIVPAFAKRRVGEDKSHRRTFRFTIQQQLLVLHNQIISVNIVRCPGFFIAELAVSQFSQLYRLHSFHHRVPAAAP